MDATTLRSVDPTLRDVDHIDLVGDAQLLFTGPFFATVDPLGVRAPCALPADRVIDSAGRLLPVDRSLDAFLRGSLTFGNPPIDLLTHVAGSPAFHDELATLVAGTVGLEARVAVTGLLFPDGYGSLAILVDIPDGWDPPRRDRLLAGFGAAHRDPMAGRLHDIVVPALTEVIDRCSPGGPGGDAVLPYFNLTYVGRTTHPQPGRATLPDDLGHLVYPRSAAPVTSDSTWVGEFFFAGYAFSLLASAQPQATVQQLEHLLLYLDVLYARMDRSAGAADQLIRGTSLDQDIDWLVALERRLRADYQALVRPTFTYDYHVLKLRDSLLHAWDTDKVRERTETLLDMARRTLERKLAQDQSRRVGRVNVALTIIAVLSLVSSVDAAVNLWAKMF
jgi:hypothetical protein